MGEYTFMRPTTTPGNCIRIALRVMNIQKRAVHTNAGHLISSGPTGQGAGAAVRQSTARRPRR